MQTDLVRWGMRVERAASRRAMLGRLSRHCAPSIGQPAACQQCQSAQPQAVAGTAGSALEGRQCGLHHFLRELLTDAARAGDVRDDVAADELAAYCRHAITAAGGLPSQAAVQRLVAITLTGLRQSAGDITDASSAGPTPAATAHPRVDEIHGLDLSGQAGRGS